MVTKKSSLQWWICIYKIPAEPSRFRVAIWRKLKEVGSIYLQNSIGILPDTPENELFLTSIHDEIKSYDGECMLLKTVFLSSEEEARIISRFNGERENEYDEFMNHCQMLIDEIEREIKRNNFTFGELDENEDELKRLHLWLGKIKKRDFFKAETYQKAEDILTKSRDMLNHFSEQVLHSTENS
jgi:hypothetical protein